MKAERGARNEVGADGGELLHERRSSSLNGNGTNRCYFPTGSKCPSSFHGFKNKLKIFRSFPFLLQSDAVELVLFSRIALLSCCLSWRADSLSGVSSSIARRLKSHGFGFNLTWEATERRRSGVCVRFCSGRILARLFWLEHPFPAVQVRNDSTVPFPSLPQSFERSVSSFSGCFF